MSKRLAVLAVAAALLLTATGVSLARQSQEPRVLVFSKTAAFRHSSIETGVAAIRKLGQENGFAVDATEDASAFTLLPRLLGNRKTAPALGALEIVFFAGVSAGSLAAPAISHWMGPRGALMVIGGILAVLVLQ